MRDDEEDTGAIVGRRTLSPGLKKLRALPIEDRAGLVKAMAHRALLAISVKAKTGRQIIEPPGMMIRAIAHSLIDAINDGDPERFMRDMKLSHKGERFTEGVTLPKRQKIITRASLIGQLARSPQYRDLSSTDAADRILEDFKKYENLDWSHDRTWRGPPDKLPDCTWYVLLSGGIPMLRPRNKLQRFIAEVRSHQLTRARIKKPKKSGRPKKSGGT
jgi:hypothetical protein